MEQAELTVGKQLVWDDNLFFGDGAPRPRPAKPARPYPLSPQLCFSLWVSWTVFSIMHTLLCAHAFWNVVSRLLMVSPSVLLATVSL